MSISPPFDLQGEALRVYVDGNGVDSQVFAVVDVNGTETNLNNGRLRVFRGEADFLFEGVERCSFSIPREFITGIEQACLNQQVS